MYSVLPELNNQMPLGDRGMFEDDQEVFMLFWDRFQKRWENTIEDPFSAENDSKLSTAFFNLQETLNY